jgi:hypothetical protein
MSQTPSSTGPTHEKPLHQRIGVLGWLRGRLRRGLFRFLEKLATTDEAKAIQAATLGNLLTRRPSVTGILGPSANPYPDLGRPQHSAVPPQNPIFITARFRTGSTLLWNLFRHVPNCTAYYEPFNERRWFDPATRGERTDRTHRQVEEYWREYDGLSFLGDHYQERWIDHDLLMEADDWNPAMKRFVESLIEHAPGRPVLQFNRVDFRLPWLRHHFPRARIIHLYRHPRDQWCSSLLNLGDCPLDVGMGQFAKHDHYYLCNWARDLKYHFPFLDEATVEHPYRLFYYIWKLSYLFGRRYADYSLAFEDLIDSPTTCLTELLAAVNVQDFDLDRLLALMEKPRAGRWSQYASESWFRDQEAACDGVLADFLAKSVNVAAKLRPVPEPARDLVVGSL